MLVTADHRLQDAIWKASPHFDERPSWAQIELVVVHCISLPENQFGTGAVEKLFLGTLDTREHDSFHDLEGVRVAPHLYIDRGGCVYQFVGFDQRAWHAGESEWCGRSGCNAFSIGIELEGSVSSVYEEAQYQSLIEVLQALLKRYAALGSDAVVGHQDISPGRKFDPGPNFDWPRVVEALYRAGEDPA